VVKMIGDEVMFAVESAGAAAEIGLSLSEAYADDELLSDVRVGLAIGPVLIQDGDFYGAVVNLASRVVNIANPGTVLMSDEFHSQLEAETGDEFVSKALRPRNLKNLGRVQVWKLSRAGEPVPSSERRGIMRWERLGGVLRELDELRDKGERGVTGQASGSADYSEPGGESESAAGGAEPGSAGSGSEPGGSGRGSAVGDSDGGNAVRAKVESSLERRDRTTP
jgi:hypothetical protein